MAPAEVAAIDSLAVAHGELLLLTPTGLQLASTGASMGLLDLHSEAGHQACAAFLCKMEAAAEALRLEVASRTYRASFSVNYRALFPDGARHYRVDVLEVSVDRHSAIWVNGDKFELSAEAIKYAEQLQHGLAELGAVLTRWRAANPALAMQAACFNALGELQVMLPQRPPRGEIVAALAAVDVAWASFEQKYIANLIDIEDQARQLVVRAAQAEQCLRVLELSETHPARIGNPGIKEAQRDLIACIARLNSVANCRGKGRDDLNEEILESAMAALGRTPPPAASTSSASSSPAYGCSSPAGAAAARVLATDVIGAYESMREYLREVKSCLERVDPHLCNNIGLVARLADWEESWEIGGRYVRSPGLLHALCDLVSKMKYVQQLTPTLASMCDGCDVELFLVLPRITLLSFLTDPTGKQAELLRILLPHRFRVPAASATTAAAGSAPSAPEQALLLEGMDPELRDLIALFRKTTRLLTGAGGAQLSDAAAAAKTAAWEVLARRAVDGSEGEEDVYFWSLAPALRHSAQQAVDTFSRELEGWSLELQRHCPEDWNNFSAVVVQCVTGTSKRQRIMKFQV